MPHITVTSNKKKRKRQELLSDDNKTIFTSCELDSAEREAVRKGEARGKREYMKEHPKCGLKGNTRAFDRNYNKIDWSIK